MSSSSSSTSSSTSGSSAVVVPPSSMLSSSASRGPHPHHSANGSNGSNGMPAMEEFAQFPVFTESSAAAPSHLRVHSNSRSRSFSQSLRAHGGFLVDNGDGNFTMSTLGKHSTDFNAFLGGNEEFFQDPTHQLFSDPPNSAVASEDDVFIIKSEPTDPLVVGELSAISNPMPIPMSMQIASHAIAHPPTLNGNSLNDAANVPLPNSLDGSNKNNAPLVSSLTKAEQSIIGASTFASSPATGGNAMPPLTSLTSPSSSSSSLARTPPTFGSTPPQGSNVPAAASYPIDSVLAHVTVRMGRRRLLSALPTPAVLSLSSPSAFFDVLYSLFHVDVFSLLMIENNSKKFKSDEIKAKAMKPLDIADIRCRKDVEEFLRNIEQQSSLQRSSPFVLDPPIRLQYTLPVTYRPCSRLGCKYLTVSPSKDHRPLCAACSEVEKKDSLWCVPKSSIRRIPVRFLDDGLRKSLPNWSEAEKRTYLKLMLQKGLFPYSFLTSLKFGDMDSQASEASCSVELLYFLSLLSSVLSATFRSHMWFFDAMKPSISAKQKKSGGNASGVATGSTTQSIAGGASAAYSNVAMMGGSGGRIDFAGGSSSARMDSSESVSAAVQRKKRVKEDNSDSDDNDNKEDEPEEKADRKSRRHRGDTSDRKRKKGRTDPNAALPTSRSFSISPATREREDELKYGGSLLVVFSDAAEAKQADDLLLTVLPSFLPPALISSPIGQSFLRPLFPLRTSLVDSCSFLLRRHYHYWIVEYVRHAPIPPSTDNQILITQVLAARHALEARYPRMGDGMRNRRDGTRGGRNRHQAKLLDEERRSQLFSVDSGDHDNDDDEEEDKKGRKGKGKKGGAEADGSEYFPNPSAIEAQWTFATNPYATALAVDAAQQNVNFTSTLTSSSASSASLSSLPNSTLNNFDTISSSTTTPITNNSSTDSSASPIAPYLSRTMDSPIAPNTANNYNSSSSSQYLSYEPSESISAMPLPVPNTSASSVAALNGSMPVSMVPTAGLPMSLAVPVGLSGVSGPMASSSSGLSLGHVAHVEQALQSGRAMGSMDMMATHQQLTRLLHLIEGAMKQQQYPPAVSVAPMSGHAAAPIMSGTSSMHSMSAMPMNMTLAANYGAVPVQSSAAHGVYPSYAGVQSSSGVSQYQTVYGNFAHQAMDMEYFTRSKSAAVPNSNQPEKAESNATVPAPAANTTADTADDDEEEETSETETDEPETVQRAAAAAAVSGIARNNNVPESAHPDAATLLVSSADILHELTRIGNTLEGTILVRSKAHDSAAGASEEHVQQRIPVVFVYRDHARDQPALVDSSTASETTSSDVSAPPALSASRPSRLTIALQARQAAAIAAASASSQEDSKAEEEKNYLSVNVEEKVDDHVIDVNSNAADKAEDVPGAIASGAESPLMSSPPRSRASSSGQPPESESLIQPSSSPRHPAYFKKSSRRQLIESLFLSSLSWTLAYRNILAKSSIWSAIHLLMGCFTWLIVITTMFGDNFLSLIQYDTQTVNVEVMSEPRLGDTYPNAPQPPTNMPITFVADVTIRAWLLPFFILGLDGAASLLILAGYGSLSMLKTLGKRASLAGKSDKAHPLDLLSVNKPPTVKRFLGLHQRGRSLLNSSRANGGAASSSSSSSLTRIDVVPADHEPGFALLDNNPGAV